MVDIRTISLENRDARVPIALATEGNCVGPGVVVLAVGDVCRDSYAEGRASEILVRVPPKQVFLGLGDLATEKDEESPVAEIF